MNIPPDIRLCSKCGLNKEVRYFSLLRGKHSEDRKSYCVQCEGLMRKAKKFNLTIEQYNALMNMRCFVCGQESSQIDKNDTVNGVLCSRCWSFLKSILPTDDEEVVTSCYNYLVFREKFPFWLKWQLKRSVPEPERPLLDLM